MADVPEDTDARMRTIAAYLDADPATQEARTRLQPRYTFDDVTLVCFVQRLLIEGYMAGCLEDIRPDMTTMLDDDIAGAMGVAWAMHKVADLTTTADGCVVLPEEDPGDE